MLIPSLKIERILKLWPRFSYWVYVRFIPTCNVLLSMVNYLVVMMIDKVTDRPTMDIAIKARQEAFLTAFAQYGVVSTASKEAGVHRHTVTDWLTTDRDDFRNRMTDAVSEHSDKLEARLFNQVLDVEKPNPILLIFALKGAKRDKYGDHVTVTNDNAHELLAAVRGLPSVNVVEGTVVAVDGESGEDAVRQSIER